MTDLSNETIQFDGKLVRIEPLRKEHFDELITTGQDLRIWESLRLDGLNEENILFHLEQALIKKEKGLHYPFTIFEKHTNKIIGTTRFWKIDRTNKKLEIGWTWLSPDYWGNHFNAETKYLLLKYCFETLKLFKVSLVASEENLRSRNAIEKLGAKLDGVLRKERICTDNVSRGFAYYSIIDEDWENLKNKLISVLTLQ